MEINWRYLIFMAIAVPLAMFYVKKMMSKVPAELTNRLQGIGLHPVNSGKSGAAAFFSTSGAEFRGTYKGWPAGYNQGAGASVKQSIHTQAGSVATGSEFWVGEALAAPPLAVTERNDDSLKRLNVTWPRTDVATGDAAFDQRFRVRCDDPAFAQRVLTPSARQWIAQAPVPLLMVHQGRVVFPLTRAPSDPQLMMKQPELFLDTAGAVAHEIRAAIQERDRLHSR